VSPSERQGFRQLPIERRGALIKVGSGEVGGKALGFPFLESLVDLKALSEEIAPHEVRLPETWVLATDIFDAFIDRNKLGAHLDNHTDDETRAAFLKADLGSSVREVLKTYIAAHPNPIAVRSSALTEDASSHPAAGLYVTFMIPNNGSEDALPQLEDAIKLVYASLFSKEARLYLHHHNIPHDDEKMAVILEEVIGSQHDDLFFPLISGVAQSLNFFPVGSIQPEDGAATIAFGLGRKIVDGHAGMRFCPKFPTLRPQFRTTQDILSGIQDEFDAVDMRTGHVHLDGIETRTLSSHPIDAAPTELSDLVSSLLDTETGIMRDCPSLSSGTRVLTFNRFIKGELFPLPKVVSRLLDATQYGFGAPVELEFALKMETDSNHQRRGILYLLQARSMPAMRNEQTVEIPNIDSDFVIMNTHQAMGHGSTEAIKHIVFVDPKDFGEHMSRDCAHEVATINEHMTNLQQKYVLMGPGRWGSCNPAVGIPVSYAVVSGAKLIAELSTSDVRTEPSQGSHFFHNVVSGGLYYLTICEKEGAFVNLDWMRSQPNVFSSRWARLIQIPRGLSIRVNGKSRKGIVFRNS
jgi:hypothetical protein